VAAAEPDLPRHPQRLPAGRKHTQIVPHSQQPVTQTGGSVDDMLTVVQDQQHMPAADDRGQRLGQRQAGLLAHPQRDGRRRGDQPGVFDLRLLNQPDAILEP
jgi:hypothetical protein